MKITFKCVIKDHCKSNFVCGVKDSFSIGDKVIPVGAKVNAVPAGKLRINDIYLNTDDIVIVEADDSDISRGRIIRRM